MPAKAKLRQACDLKPQSLDARKTLIESCIQLAKRFQAKKWQKNASEVAKWVLELEPENATAKKILGK